MLMVVCQESVIRESGIRPEISTRLERLRGLADKAGIRLPYPSIHLHL